MIPVKQKLIHIPRKQSGDCWRACLSSILECDIDDFPPPPIGDWRQYCLDVLRILQSKGYQWIGYSIENVDSNAIVSPDTDGYVIAVGKSPRSTPRKRINHAVVWKNGIVHDPHPDNNGIKDIISFEILVKIL